MSQLAMMIHVFLVGFEVALSTNMTERSIYNVLLL